MNVELRNLSLAESRLAVVESKTGTRGLRGYASVFNSPSLILDASHGEFQEIICPGAFDRTLSTGEDITAEYNHNGDYLLGRTSAGTLRLKTDAKGLFYEVDLPDTSAGRDVFALVRRGDIKGSSFAFITVRDHWTNNGAIREVLDLRLIHVAPVVNPAYPQTAGLTATGRGGGGGRGFVSRWDAGTEVQRRVEELSARDDQRFRERLAAAAVPRE